MNESSRKSSPESPLSTEDLDYERAEKRIEILEQYESYLSETFPVSETLNKAMAKNPMLEPVMEALVTRIVSGMDHRWTNGEILEHAIDVLKNDILPELDGTD